MSVLVDFLLQAGSVLAATPSPVPSPTPSLLPAYTGDPNLITPGVVGFGAIFFVALATVFLILDMTRRVRRTRYRSEVRERLAEERGEEPLP